MWLPTLVHHGPVTTDQTHDLVNCIRLLDIQSSVFYDEEEHSEHRIMLSLIKNNKNILLIDFIGSSSCLPYKSDVHVKTRLYNSFL
jgi:hypothetical protein